MSNITILVGTLVAVVTINAIWFLYQRRFSSPLNRIPGPFLARFTRSWYLWRVSKGHFEEENVALHRKFGSIVRIAPGWYSVNSAEALKKIYAPGSRFIKSDWYDAWKHPDPEQWSLFSDRNERRHSENKKTFAGLYALSSLVHYESFVDSCVDLFVDRLCEASRTNTEMDLSHWMQCYAFDVVGYIVYGERYGFLDKGEDIQGAIKGVSGVAPFSTLVGIYSEWYPLAFKINSYLNGPGATSRAFLTKFAKEKVDRHKANQEKQASITGGLNDDEASTGSPEALMTKLLRSQRESPEKVTDYHLFVIARSTVLAGFDTTAISLTATLYYLLKTPRVLHKLRSEIEAARTNKILTTGWDRIDFRESQELPYLKAVVKEALRIHSATGLPLWRVVPEGGVEIEGVEFPAGSVLGANTWAAHYDEDVFTNPAEFRPERWIDEDPEKLKAMNQLYMPFGLGSRTCIGRHISTLEMFKLIPVLVDRFDFEITSSPAKEKKFETTNFWFVKPHDINVRVQERT